MNYVKKAPSSLHADQTLHNKSLNPISGSKCKTSLGTMSGTMSLSIRIPLFLLIFFVDANPLWAHHLASQNQSVYEHHPSRTDQDLKKYTRKLSQAYENYRKNTSQVWGDDTVLPDARTDVTYRDNYKQRSIIDYEQGKVSVELAIKEDQTSDKKRVRHSLEQAIEQTILQTPDERSIIDIAKHPEPPKSDKPPVLAGLIANDDGTPLTTNNIAKFKQVKTRRLKQRTITGRDGRQRIVYRTQFDLVPDHIRKRAQRFRRAVDRNATLRRIPAALIFAVMETESFFNPYAKSPIPAFGLMQLVPASGARDAYKFLHARDKVVKERYLYNPNNNIELGAAYLHILYFRYFNQIRDPQSRLWATIAAYNAGFQNVIKTYAGEFDATNHAAHWIWRRRAINKINKMKAEQVYEYFCDNLPFEESRDYLRKVRERMGKYQI